MAMLTKILALHGCIYEDAGFMSRVPDHSWRRRGETAHSKEIVGSYQRQMPKHCVAFKCQSEAGYCFCYVYMHMIPFVPKLNPPLTRSCLSYFDSPAIIKTQSRYKGYPPRQKKCRSQQKLSQVRLMCLSSFRFLSLLEDTRNYVNERHSPPQWLTLSLF